MTRDATIGEELRFVRNLDEVPPDLRMRLARLADNDDAAAAKLYNPERETYFRK